ncbi:MAG: hypothetical protein B7Y36_07985 [Novosphingobium sp. 28-62-57]|uniref:DUF6931 family protein n=1 Tax=unclassified Novosphingobium TaxID=2644732 RepID=UPI000BC9BE9E|nr:MULTISPECIES: hypothetical protein [unclassified Novosphingobium]OYW47867.1 MAG: hypothetical protein B7Z36_01075 [Novosphingobium sp. 12-63-9]OYZ10760.1 MAG: hypothetical protein B7Y36_07985 [Novosphingobium sp. 28-62-57]OZA37875.1 MAG: hypothetical protein B7X92_04300 [Novosphingobium sp. 17-62-9]HQS68975.1 hypothetical protein [Novosphingobium sp.]
MGEWKLSTWADAAQLAASVNRREVPAEARGIAPAAWFALLREGGEETYAVNYIAHAMPRYECVIWAVRTMIEIGIDRADPAIVAALRWIDNPSDRLRRAAAELGESLDDETPQALLCKAIFLSGGSISEEDLPAIQPPPDVCAKLAAAAVLTAAFKGKDPPAKIATSLQIAETVLAGA